MAQTIPAIVALLIAAVGWYYLFYSRAAQRLEGVEEQRTNRLRGTLRRANAVIMLLMAVCIAWGSIRMTRLSIEASVLIWTAVLVLLFVSVILALIDVRLTVKLRRTLRERSNRP